MAKPPSKKFAGSTKKLPSSELRIIGGSWRGRKLGFPAVEGLRPTGDRLRETLFNWLMPEIQGARVLDLFAGSGALGIESLSRGADFCLLLEKHPGVAANLTENLQKLSTSKAKVVATDSIEFLKTGNADEAFNLVFIDPPFAADLWEQCSTHLSVGNWLAAESWIYVETPRDSSWQAPEGWQLYRNKEAGQVRYRLFKNF